MRRYPVITFCDRSEYFVENCDTYFTACVTDFIKQKIFYMTTTNLFSTAIYIKLIKSGFVKEWFMQNRRYESWAAIVM